MEGPPPRPQETTLDQNLSTCLPESPLRSEGCKQVRIILTPLSATGGEGHYRHLTQKCLLEEFSSCEESSGEEPKAKKACTRLSDRQTRAVTCSTESRRPASVAATASNDLEEEGDSESETPTLDNYSTQLSAYERKRLKNITENAKFFASLKLFESAERLRKITTKGQPHGIRTKPTKTETKPICRRSMRLQRVDPLGAPLPELRPQPEPSMEEHPRLPPGPLQMIPADRDQETELTEGFLNLWARISQETLNKAEKPVACNLESYKASLRRMVLREDAVAKVVKNRIHSVAIHPSESRTLVAAGDKWGQMGLWNLDCKLEDGVHVFELHSQAVSCMHFSPFNPAHLLSLSHDGTLRCGDVTRAVFDEVYRNEEYNLSSFDFLASDASTLIVGMWDGEVAVVDRRTPGTSAELSADLNSKTRTVHVHPVSRHHFLAAGAGNVNIYDVRHLKQHGSSPAVSLVGHTKSVASAYFSPVTGNRVVTTCADDKLRIFGTNCLSSLAPILTTIRHNNNTGRWLTRFRAIWDAKREDCFVVGSMSRPRQIEVFHASGELVHSFLSEDYLGSVCSINAWHPTRYIVVGGNSSGRLHVFRE
ncbi:WD repeat-containing protein 76 isoform X2 [Hemicordylus capensis]|uniref:WD repeat-containing protein 76 isoform X2 n=1 Tax=Hemicordylus capensis TaxID=884348 RepID=UPI002302C1CC|nr:WD repeat-containing protein 76 isoform X2 [Hemicordylus capensis]